MLRALCLPAMPDNSRSLIEHVRPYAHVMHCAVCGPVICCYESPCLHMLARTRF